MTSSLFSPADMDYALMIVKEAGALGSSFQKSDLATERKDDRSIVTEADVAVQTFLLEKLQERFPDYNYIHEEHFDRSIDDVNEEVFSFIIDPIDGTALYSMGLPFWSVSLGLLCGYELIRGIVYSPGCDMLFYSDGIQTYLNGRPVMADNALTIDSETSVFVASEVPRLFSLELPGKLRNLGSTALHAALLADNKRNRSLAFIGSSFLWDWAGALPVLRTAGIATHYIDGTAIDIEAIIRNRYRMEKYVVAYTTLSRDEIIGMIS